MRSRIAWPLPFLLPLYFWKSLGSLTRSTHPPLGNALIPILRDAVYLELSSVEKYPTERLTSDDIVTVALDCLHQLANIMLWMYFREKGNIPCLEKR